jgi:hypothetical protein
VFRTVIVALAAAALAAFVATPASAKVGGAQSFQPRSHAVAHFDRKPKAKPRRKPKKVLRCAIFGRYIPACGK